MERPVGIALSALANLMLPGHFRLNQRSIKEANGDELRPQETNILIGPHTPFAMQPLPC